MQDQCKYVRRGKAQNVFSIYGHFPLPVFANDACHRHDRPLTRPAFSSREGPIEQPKSILYKLVQLRFSWGHRARCFLGNLRQHWCILREYVMGFFPDSPRIQKQVWVPGMCFAQLAHLELCKRIVKASPLSYIWRTYIMFDLESVKVFTRNLRRRIAPYPKELWLAFGVTIVFLACFLIYSLAFYNAGQKSSELKGRYGKHWVVILENLKTLSSAWAPSFGSVSEWLFSINFIIRELLQRRLQGQKERQKTKSSYTNKNSNSAHKTHWYISLPWLHDYDVKSPYTILNESTFNKHYETPDHESIFILLGLGPQEINPREIHPHMVLKTSWNSFSW